MGDGATLDALDVARATALRRWNHRADVLIVLLLGSASALVTWAAYLDARADAYVFLTVLTAVALFFGGVATKISLRQAQISLLAIAGVMLSYCIMRGLTMPWAADAVAGFTASETMMLQEASLREPKAEA